jgi:hypothetical protein
MLVSSIIGLREPSLPERDANQHSAGKKIASLSRFNSVLVSAVAAVAVSVPADAAA